jgi:hypothetical protein
MGTPSLLRLSTAETNIATNTTGLAAVVALQTVDVTLQITTTELTDSDAQQTFDFAAALPAGAFVIGCWVEVTTEVDDGAAGTATCDVDFLTRRTSPRRLAISIFHGALWPRVCLAD